MLAKRYNVVQMRQFFSSKSCVRLLSLPMRGEWIEMAKCCAWIAARTKSLPMRGEWIEIIHQGLSRLERKSLPMRGEWIEIFPASMMCSQSSSLPMRGEWIEINGLIVAFLLLQRSLPMRGEWIEILTLIFSPSFQRVSPHAGRVD